MFASFRLSQLPGYGKLFVALFTILMLCVCLWAMWIYYLEKGQPDPDNLPAYLSQEAGEQPEVRGKTDLDDDTHETTFRHNLGLAHTHINGQTLLFFALGFVYLFTSRTARNKKVLFSIFAVSILMHTIGLTGNGMYWLWDDLLAISGIVLLLTIAYMAIMILVDLVRTGESGVKES